MTLLFCEVASAFDDERSRLDAPSITQIGEGVEDDMTPLDHEQPSASIPRDLCGADS